MLEPITSSEARLLVLEATVAAVAAQLPPKERAEVAGMLVYLAEASDAAAAIAGEERHSSHVRDWATKMLERVMVSRKATSGGAPARED